MRNLNCHIPLVNAHTTVLIALVITAQATAQQLSTAAPQPQLDNKQTLTLDAALQLTEQYSPLLRGASSQIAGAESGIVAARVYPNPYFYYLTGPQYARPIPTPGIPGLLQRYAVSQPMELPSARRTRIAAAEYARESSRFGLTGAQLYVRATVKRAFYDVLRRREEIEHTQENLKLLQDLRRRTDVQVSVGEAARLELTRAEAEIATAQNAVKGAQLLYTSAVSALRAAISAPLSQDLEAEGELDSTVKLPRLDELRGNLLTNHPVLAQANAELERARAVLAHERALRKPQPQLDAEYERQPDLQYFRFGVSLPLPIWDRRKGQIGQAEAAVNTAEAVFKQRRLELVSELERAYAQYQIAEQQVNSFQAGALRQANAALEASQAAYRLGARGIIEVLDAQRVLQTVRGELLDARFERQTAIVDLEGLGVLKPGNTP
jgi:cobalt-zinc-cadmium efflux system outer membrane protein